MGSAPSSSADRFGVTPGLPRVIAKVRSPGQAAARGLSSVLNGVSFNDQGDLADDGGDRADRDQGGGDRNSDGRRSEPGLERDLKQGAAVFTTQDYATHVALVDEFADLGQQVVAADLKLLAVGVLGVGVLGGDVLGHDCLLLLRHGVADVVSRVFRGDSIVARQQRRAIIQTDRSWYRGRSRT